MQAVINLRGLTSPGVAVPVNGIDDGVSSTLPGGRHWHGVSKAIKKIADRFASALARNRGARRRSDGILSPSVNAQVRYGLITR